MRTPNPSPRLIVLSGMDGVGKSTHATELVDELRKQGHWAMIPDIEVDNLPHATWKGDDAQLHRAVEYLRQRIAQEPPPRPPAPAYPDKSALPEE